MDMLIKLYALKFCHEAADALGRQGICIRRAMAYERGKAVGWVRENFKKAVNALEIPDSTPGAYPRKI